MSCLEIPITVQECDLVSILRGRTIFDGQIHTTQVNTPPAGSPCGTYPLTNGQVWYSDGVTVVMIEDTPAAAHTPYVLTNLIAPFSHNTLAQTGNVPPPVSGDAGNVIVADVNGSSFLDCAAILACVPAGHTPYVLTNNAAPFSHNTLAQTGNVPPAVSANAGNVIVADANGSSFLDCAAINACVPAPTPNIAHGILRTDVAANDFLNVQHTDELGGVTNAQFPLGCGLGKNAANEAIVNPTLPTAQAETLNTACVGDAVVPTFEQEASCTQPTHILAKVGGVWVAKDSSIDRVVSGQISGTFTVSNPLLLFIGAAIPAVGTIIVQHAYVMNNWSTCRPINYHADVRTTYAVKMDVTDVFGAGTSDRYAIILSSGLVVSSPGGAFRAGAGVPPGADVVSVGAGSLFDSIVGQIPASGSIAGTTQVTMTGRAITAGLASNLEVGRLRTNIFAVLA